MKKTAKEIADLRRHAQASFWVMYELAVLWRSLRIIPYWLLHVLMIVLIWQEVRGSNVDPAFHQLLMKGAAIYLAHARQGKVFVGFDDGCDVLCLACAATLQGEDAIANLAAFSQGYAICDTDAVAASLNCTVCNRALLP